jgi:hypothetical protein
VPSHQCAQVPLLTADNLRTGRLAPNSLVRVVGQVQDTMDAEMYPAVMPTTDHSSSSGSSGSGITYCAFKDTLRTPAGGAPSGPAMWRVLMDRCVGGGAAVGRAAAGCGGSR